jgi:hypothetical protein
MVLLVLSIGSLQNIMDLLEDVLNMLNESGGFVGLILDMGDIFSVWFIEVVQHQWDPRVRIPIPLEMGYGWWSYGELYSNYVEHRGESHPMYGYA